LHLRYPFMAIAAAVNSAPGLVVIINSYR